MHCRSFGAEAQLCLSERKPACLLELLEGNGAVRSSSTGASGLLFNFLSQLCDIPFAEFVWAFSWANFHRTLFAYSVSGIVVDVGIEIAVIGTRFNPQGAALSSFVFQVAPLSLVQNYFMKAGTLLQGTEVVKSVINFFVFKGAVSSVG